MGLSTGNEMQAIGPEGVLRVAEKKVEFDFRNLEKGSPNIFYSHPEP